VTAKVCEMALRERPSWINTSTVGHLAHLASEAGFPAMPGAQAAEEDPMRLD